MTLIGRGIAAILAKVAKRRHVVVASVGEASAIAFLSLRHRTSHPGEAVLLLMPPALAAMLWLGWRDVRRLPLRGFLIYILVMVPLIAAAEAFAAKMAGGRILHLEIFWALWFLVAWRLAWALWKRTVGRAGENYRRWGRLARLRRDPRRFRVLLTRTIGPLRGLAVVCLFVPLLVGSLIHRIKIGNPSDLSSYAYLNLEPVSFRTGDGLQLSGWFMSQPGADSTVVICHGLGANKGNFIDFLGLFAGYGYNALIFDFRGHGDSDGHTATFGLFEVADVRAAVDWLKRERPEQARRVFGLGSSMGAMALVREAADDPRIEAIVLDSAYLSAAELVCQHAARLPVLGPAYGRLILASASLHAGRSLTEVDGGDAIARISPRPVLLIHGRDDILIPPRNMEMLFRRAHEPKSKWLGPGPHSNIMTTDFEAYQRRVIEFFDRAGGKKKAPSTR